VVEFWFCWIGVYAPFCECLTALHYSVVRLVARYRFERYREFPLNGGVLVSTEGLITGSHAEDDSLASLKIESKKINANQELALAA
jgi:hypothetical protein